MVCDYLEGRRGGGGLRREVSLSLSLSLSLSFSLSLSLSHTRIIIMTESL